MHNSIVGAICYTCSEFSDSLLAGPAEPADSWRWITGEPWIFDNWSPGEPNNLDSAFGGNEDALIFDHGVNSSGKSWNDLHRENPLHAGFVVEFEPTTQPVPEPTSLLLLLAGASGMLLLSRKRTNKLLF